jgi:hypothetical protein
MNKRQILCDALRQVLSSQVGVPLEHLQGLVTGDVR